MSKLTACLIEFEKHLMVGMGCDVISKLHIHPIYNRTSSLTVHFTGIDMNILTKSQCQILGMLEV